MASIEDIDEEFESWFRYGSYGCLTGGGGGGGEFTRQEELSSVLGTSRSEFEGFLPGRLLQQLVGGETSDLGITFAGARVELSSGVFGGLLGIPGPL